MDWAYLAFEQYEDELLREIQFHGIQETIRKGRLFILKKDLDLTWAQLKIKNPQSFQFQSIKEAADFLKSKNLFWGHSPTQFHRRAELIQEKLSNKKEKPIDFLKPTPKKDFGFWSLLDEKTLLYSEKTGHAYPLNEVQFIESPEPPSRAYLKLWETFTLHTPPPPPNAQVLDLGACPGGWTWVLDQLGCQVISVDKAPLDVKLQKKPKITFLKKDAFKLDPKDIKNPEWLFSDIICEPIRLLELVENWLKVHPQLKMVCTIKYKGVTDHPTTQKMKAIPGSRVVHLNCNKHEVTWIRLPKP